MALGDGTAWDETTPSNATNLRDGDDHQRDLRIGTRIRLAKEHVTPAAASVGGEHTFITLQTQGAKPALAGAQTGGLYLKDVGAGVIELFYEDEAGNEIQVTSGSGTINNSGNAVQILNTQISAVNTGTTIFPFDDTIPQITEGDEYMTLAITPTSATNLLKIDIVFYGALSTNDILGLALFQDATAGALAAITNATGIVNTTFSTNFTHFMVSGTAVATTFRLRAGGSTAGTTTFNGASSARKLGGVAASSITITEYKV